MGRSPCCAKEGLNRGAWTAMEDKILIEYIKVHGEGRWRNLPKRAGLKRCGKSCRLRWLNYLRPDIKRGNITPDEEELIIRLHKLLGNRWSLIAGRLPGRTDNEIKNYWNTNLGKRMNQHFQANTSASKHQKKTRTDQKNKRPLSINQLMTPTRRTESNVVRTKAVRCTKLFINPPEPQLQPQSSDDHANYDPTNTSSNNIFLVDRNSSRLLLDDQDNNNIVSDFMVEDFNVGDFNLISELLNSEFSDICDFSNESSCSANDLSPNSPGQPFIFSQELLEDWLGDQQNDLTIN